MTVVDAPSPAPAGQTPDPFAHEGLLYRGPDEFVTGVLPFVLGGLAAAEPVLVAVPGPNLALLRAVLGPVAGRVRLLDMADAGRNPGRIIPGVLHAFITEHAATRSRIVGEPVWYGRSAAEYPACVQHEALINAAFAGWAATILCPYDAGQLDPTVLADAARTHPVLVDGGTRLPSAAYTGAGPVVADFNQPLPAPPAGAATLIFDTGGLAPVRRFVAARATRAGLGPDRAADLEIAANEVAANTVDHTGRPGTLRVWVDDGAVICEISDQGRLTDPLAGRLPPAHTSERGRGLMLVNLLCDLVRTHTGPDGTTVRLYLRL